MFPLLMPSFSATLDLVELRPTLAEVKSVLFPFIPVNAERFANSISKFIEQGGKLTFSINPQNPLPIISSMGLLVMPDLAIESLGIKLLAE